MDIPQLLDYERKRLFVVPHASKKEHHLWYESSFVADPVSLRTLYQRYCRRLTVHSYIFEIVVVASSQEIN